MRDKDDPIPDPIPGRLIRATDAERDPSPCRCCSELEVRCRELEVRCGELEARCIVLQARRGSDETLAAIRATADTLDGLVRMLEHLLRRSS